MDLPCLASQVISEVQEMSSVERGALHTWEGIMPLFAAHAARGFHPRSIKARVCSDRIGTTGTTGWNSFVIPLPSIYNAMI